MLVVEAPAVSACREDAEVLLCCKVHLDTVWQREYLVVELLDDFCGAGQRDALDVYLVVDGDIELLAELGDDVCGSGCEPVVERRGDHVDEYILRGSASLGCFCCCIPRCFQRGVGIDAYLAFN